MSLQKKEIQTHPNFISLDPSIVDAAGIYDNICMLSFFLNGLTQDREDKTERKTRYRRVKEQKSIRSDLEKIDRLYHIRTFYYCFCDRDSDEFVSVEFIARIRHGAEEIYIALEGDVGLSNGRLISCKIFRSRDGEEFVNAVLDPNYHSAELIKNILQSLIDDGVVKADMKIAYNGRFGC